MTLIPPEIEKPPQKAAAELFNGIIQENESHSETRNEDIENLKRHFKQLDPNLLFDEGFYPKALGFLTAHKLKLDYLSWFYSVCRKKNPHNLAGYYFKTFFESRYVELFLEASQPPPVYLISCPVCSVEHNTADPACPQCALSKDRISDKKEISLRRQLFEMKPEIRTAYEAELELVLDNSGQDFMEKLKQMANLKCKYGLLTD